MGSVIEEELIMQAIPKHQWRAPRRRRKRRRLVRFRDSHSGDYRLFRVR
jgi:hypothetical protein